MKWDIHEMVVCIADLEYTLNQSNVIVITSLKRHILLNIPILLAILAN